MTEAERQALHEAFGSCEEGQCDCGTERNPSPVRALHDNPVAVVLREGSIGGRRLA